MPQTSAATKALRVSARRRSVNDRWRVALRKAVRQVRDAITAADKSTAEKSLVEAQSVIDRATRHHILHPNTAARKKSSLAVAVKKLGASK